MPDFLPPHLRKYVVAQEPARYTALDQAVWRYVLRQLRSFLSKHAHSSYLEGLEKTGITTDHIPSIEDISEKIEKFGWRALPVSGFIPPAAFMELQSLSVLPIASDMRSIDHLLYTPAPDIVHEAAGHAPILVHPEFAAYLKKYAAVAKKAIISREDLDVYQGIRALSDIKENPQSTPQDIKDAEENLAAAIKNVTHISEASLLGRMNWWTAEYGLIGDLESPKIFGAGLLSSVGESRWCLSDKVKKLPLSIDCLNYSYDITEPQPQLFVARDFQHLSDVLEELSLSMAYRTGGPNGVKKAIQADTVNTIELDTGIQVSGRCKEMIEGSDGSVIYLVFQGPTQLSFGDSQLPGHGKEYHAQGFGTPVGDFTILARTQAGEVETPIDSVTKYQWVLLRYKSGVEVEGRFQCVHNPMGRNVVLALTEATCRYGQRILFQPEWGQFDIALGRTVASVFGGPADRLAYGESEDFPVARVPQAQFSESEKIRHSNYQKLRDLRNQFHEMKILEAQEQKSLKALFEEHQKNYPSDWLFFLEVHELTALAKHESLMSESSRVLGQIASQNSETRSLIDDGLKLVRESSQIL